MKILICRNSAPGAPRFKRAHLPVRQTLIWVGPWFVLLRGRQPR